MPSVGNDDEPLLAASHQVVAFFCVGETLSVPLLHGSWKASTHPLTRAVLRRIVADEADHGTFGWAYLDWAVPHLTAEDLEALGATADAAIGGVLEGWGAIRERPAGPDYPIGDLGWMENEAYLSLAQRSLDKLVVAPLRARGIPVRAVA